MKMNRAALAQKEAWQKAGVALPQYDVAAMAERTKEAPVWLHFGAGNIFRGFIAALQQRLLNEGLADRGIIAADTFDYEIITKIYDAFDCLTMNVTLNADATTSREIIASVAEGLRADAKDAAAILTYAAAAGAGQSTPLYSADDRTMEDLAFYLAEVNTSGDADAKDAALILAYAAAAGSGEPKTWEEILGAA